MSPDISCGPDNAFAPKYGVFQLAFFDSGQRLSLELTMFCLHKRMAAMFRPDRI